MGKDNKILPVGTDEGVPHQVCVHHRHAVIRQGNCTGFFQSLGIRQGLALLPHGNRGDGQHINAAALGSAFIDIAHPLRAIDHRFGVGHAGDGGKAAMGSSVGAGNNVLFIGKTGVTEVNMDINKAGADRQSGGIQYLSALALQILANTYDLAVFDQDIGNMLGTQHRINQITIFNQQFHETEDTPRLIYKIAKNLFYYYKTLLP